MDELFLKTKSYLHTLKFTCDDLQEKINNINEIALWFNENEDKFNNFFNVENIDVNILKNKKKELENENKALKTSIKHYHNRINDDNHNCAPISINNKQIEVLQTSLVPLNSAILRRLNKLDIMVIILNREAYLYEKIKEYEDGIKNNDRKIFKNQQEEIKKLTNILIDDSILYKSNKLLKEKIIQ